MFKMSYFCPYLVNFLLMSLLSLFQLLVGGSLHSMMDLTSNSDALLEETDGKRMTSKRRNGPSNRQLSVVPCSTEGPHCRRATNEELPENQQLVNGNERVDIGKPVDVFPSFIPGAMVQAGDLEFLSSLHLVACGSEGAVYEGLGPHGAVCAYKLIAAEEYLQVLSKETLIMQRLSQHPFIVNSLASGVVEVEDWSGLIMEWATGGDVLEYISADIGMKQEDAARWFIQVAFGVKSLHAIGWCHGDLKPDNIMIQDNGRVQWAMVGDFGMAVPFHAKPANVSRKLRHQKWARKVYPPHGTVQYAPLEVLRAHKSIASGDLPRVDVWCLGATLYVMLHGKHPYPGDSREEVMQSILNGHRESYRPDLDPRLEHLLDAMLEVDYRQRYTMDDVLSHPWVAERLRVLRMHGHVEESELGGTNTLHGSRLDKTSLSSSMDGINQASGWDDVQDCFFDPVSDHYNPLPCLCLSSEFLSDEEDTRNALPFAVS